MLQITEDHLQNKDVIGKVHLEIILLLPKYYSLPPYLINYDNLSMHKIKSYVSL